jgi:hypothetical protein
LERSVAAAYTEDEHFDEFAGTMGGGDDGSVSVRARESASQPPSPLAHLLASSAEDLERDYLRWQSTSPRRALTPGSLAMLHGFGESLASDAAGPWHALEVPTDTGRERARKAGGAVRAPLYACDASPAEIERSRRDLHIHTGDVCATKRMRREADSDATPAAAAA